MIINRFSKKAGSRLLTPWLFFVFAIIGIGIVLGVVTFYSVSSDIREEEARIMTIKLTRAIISDGYLNKGVLQDNFNILDAAGLNKDMFVPGGNFYLSLTVSDLQDGRVKQRLVAGEKDFSIQCHLKGKHLAKCYSIELIALDGEDSKSKFKVEILAGSNQVGGKV